MNNNRNRLSTLGFDDTMLNQAAAQPGLYPGRVVLASRELFRVRTAQGEVQAGVTGKLRYEAADGAGLPVVGDFVLLDRESDAGGSAAIHTILPRRSLFCRRAAGTGNDIQPVAANIDTVLICMALGHDFNLRRLERYLAIAWDSGATPVVVLTKKDLCDDLDARLAEVEGVAIGVEVLCTSSLDQSTPALLAPWTGPGATCALIGSSGVGKSTLINLLLGQEALATGEVRGDEKGRHTTTHRELLLLPGGGCVIDTPGMRELGLESGDLDRSFADIAELALRCRFRDCSHTNEPGCAVLEAVDQGALDQERLQSYRKLQKELGYDGLSSRQIEEKKLDSMLAGMGSVKEVRRYLQEKNRRKGR